TVYAYATGIEANNINQLLVYPIPANDKLIVSSTTPIQQTRINDITGRIYMTFAPGTSLTTIDISTLATGVYVVEVNTNNSIITKRFIKL
ncbi:MAG TPA: T9SS type A sorting domain-containing protein, partial [Chitinophagales bacterium]|nr:T9SS type A sorting domain-containing protein [Chitinophagales bacterium]